MPFGIFRGFGGGGEAKSEPSSNLADAAPSSSTQERASSNRRNIMDHYGSWETDNSDSFNEGEFSHKSKRSYSISTDTFRMPRGLLSGFGQRPMSTVPELGDETNLLTHATTATDDAPPSMSQSIFSSVFGGGGGRFRRRAMSVDSGSAAAGGLLGNTSSFADGTKTSELSMLNNKGYADPESPTLGDEVFQQTSKFSNASAAECMPSTMPANDHSIPMEQQIPCDIRQSVPILVSFVQY